MYNGKAVYFKGNGMDSLSVSNLRNLRQQAIDRRYNEIYRHELAHKNAAGALGGSIVIEKDADGVPIGGHVEIKMPVLNESNPDETIEHADVVIKSALAPSDPSEQDYRVAAKARAVKTQAISCKNGHKIDYYA